MHGGGSFRESVASGRAGSQADRNRFSRPEPGGWGKDSLMATGTAHPPGVHFTGVENDRVGCVSDRAPLGEAKVRFLNRRPGSSLWMPRALAASRWAPVDSWQHAAPIQFCAGPCRFTGTSFGCTGPGVLRPSSISFSKSACICRTRSGSAAARLVFSERSVARL
jgi:hypothetical protein